MKSKIRSISFVILASSSLLHSRTNSGGQPPTYDRRMVFSFSGQVHGYPIQASYYTRIPNQRIWNAAGRPTLPSQTLLPKQQSRLIKGTPAAPPDPLHHAIFSPGYQDRIKFPKSRNRGYPRQYWFAVVSSQAIKLAEGVDHSAQIQNFSVQNTSYINTKAFARVCCADAQR